MNQVDAAALPRDGATGPGAEQLSMGGLLVAAGALRPDQVGAVLQCQRQRGLRFGEAALALGLLEPAAIERALAIQFRYPYVAPGEHAYAAGLSMLYAPHGEEAAAFRAVRSHLLQHWFSAQRRSLALVGLDDGDGVSLFAANLAIACAQSRRSTLLLDANLRAPRQQRLFALDGRRGLSELLANRPVTDPLRPLPPFSQLFLLPAGSSPPNPLELLAEPAYAVLHERLASHHDIVLVDTPAWRCGPDLLASAALAGGALLVLRRHQSRLNEVRTLRARLEAQGTTVVAYVISNT